MDDGEDVQERARQALRLTRSIGLQIAQADQGIGRLALIEVTAALMRARFRAVDLRNEAIAQDCAMIAERAGALTHEDMAWIFAKDPDVFLARAAAKALTDVAAELTDAADAAEAEKVQSND